MSPVKKIVVESVEKTGAIGLSAKAGRYGGTYAHLNAIEADKQFRKLPSGQSDTKLLQ